MPLGAKLKSESVSSMLYESLGIGLGVRWSLQEPTLLGVSCHSVEHFQGEEESGV